MKTKVIRKCGSDCIERLILDPPRAVFGSTVIPESFALTMKVGGLRKMLDELADEDTFRIETFSGGKATEYSFIKHTPGKQVAQ